ncbi:MAG: type II secretion system protein GspN [Bdellovibrionaceae bacterium]|nr:type II secretion system protein GspN [Pseudobdellovibrionaceae bacterium]
MIKKVLFRTVAVLMFALLFAFLTFPYGDLDKFLYDEAVVSKVYVKTDDISLSLLGLPSLQATGVIIEPTAGGPIERLELDELSIRPLLSALLTFKPGATLAGRGLFGGDFEISAALNPPPKDLQNGFGQLAISSLELNDVSLSRAMSALMPSAAGTKIGGTVSALAPSLVLDLLMQGTGVVPVNPVGEMSLNLRDLGPIKSVPVPVLGELEIPPLKLSKSELSVNVRKTRVSIANSSIGSEKDPLRGRILGDFAMALSPLGASFGAFTYCAELTISEAYLNALKTKFGAQLFEMLQTNLLTKFKREASGPGYHIGIKQSGGDFMRALRNELSANEVPQPGSCNGFEVAK